jgi:hypothetical protein
MKRILAVICMLMLCTSAWAGDAAKGKQMETMKAEMMKCAVCKHIAMHMDEIGPIQTEVIHLNDGMAMTHTVAPEKMSVFQAASAECSKAGMASMSLTEEQAKTQLCPLCQGIRSAVKAGATLSQGNTKNGDIMVLTSSDPKTQMQLTDLGQKCAMMIGEGQAKR